MFDIGFSEILVIGVVALVVIGPERLPKTARTLGHLFGRLQRYVSEVKADISREMELDELRKLQREMQGAAREFHQSVTTAASDVQAGIRNVERELNQAGTGADGSTQAGTTHGTAPTGAPQGSGASAPVASAESPIAADASRQSSLPGFDKI
jgi:sec-independent protein translocase protein TatB